MIEALAVAFAAGAWGCHFPAVVKMWRQAWEHVIPFLRVPPAVRRVIYTTNALESVHARVRKVIKTRGCFPTDAAATTLIWLALRNITADWSQAAHHGRAAKMKTASHTKFQTAPRAVHLRERSSCSTFVTAFVPTFVAAFVTRFSPCLRASSVPPCDQTV
jgi:hypothetical protein